MPVQNKLTGRAASIPKGLAIGSGWAIIWTAICITAISFLVSKEFVAFEMIGYGVIFTLISASYICAKISCSKIKQKRLLVSIYAACIYFILLMIVNLLCFGGEYTAVGVTLLCVICGATVSLMGNGMREDKRHKGTYKNRQR